METNYSIGSEASNGKKTTCEKGGTSFHLSAHRLLSDVSLITLIILRQLYLKWLYTSLALSIIQLDLRPKLCIYFFIFSPLIILSLMQSIIDLIINPLAVASLESNPLITFAVVQNRPMPMRHLQTSLNRHIMNLETPLFPLSFAAFLQKFK